MSDTGARLRTLFEQIAPPIEIGAVMSATEPVAYRRRAWLIAAAAAGITVLVGVGVWLLIARPRPEPPVVTSPPATTSTTGAATTTTTLAGGGLDTLAGFHAGPVPPEATCPPGSTPSVAGDPDAVRPPYASRWFGGDWSAAFDRQSGLLVEVVLERPQSEGAHWATWTFDPCRNRWQEMPSAGFDPVGFVSPIIYDADSDRVVGVDTVGTVWVYDTDTDVWTSRPWAPGRPALPNDWPGFYHDPSGLIVFTDPWGDGVSSAWAYDVDTDLLYEITPWGAAAGDLIYDPVGDRLYLFTVGNANSPFGRKSLAWRWEPGEGWVDLGLAAPPALFDSPECGMFDLEGGPFVFDEATGHIIVFCQGTVVAAFDPATSAWQAPQGSVTDGPGDVGMAVYDSANDRLLLLDGGGDVWAYDGPTGTLTELLAAAG